MSTVNTATTWEHLASLRYGGKDYAIYGVILAQLNPSVAWPTLEHKDRYRYPMKSELQGLPIRPCSHVYQDIVDGAPDMVAGGGKSLLDTALELRARYGQGPTEEQ